MHPPRTRTLVTTLMEFAPGDVVLVATADPNAAIHLVDTLEDFGHAVVGPVERAAAALVLAGQAPVTRAIVYTHLAGERGGRQLAEALRANFGIATLLIDEEAVTGGGGHRPVA